jgi:hypothetical protein
MTGRVLPTISFISFGAGLMLALALLSPPGPHSALPSTPSGAAAAWMHVARLPYGAARCPIDCEASRAPLAAGDHEA